MNADRYQQLVTIFHDACERPLGERAAFLRQACGEDEELRAEAAAMLDVDLADAGVLNSPAGDLAAELVATQARTLTGTVLGRYHVLAFLGRGGMGQIFLAEDAQLQRKAVLKMLPDEYARDPDRLRQLEHEARAVSAANHPNIVTIYGLEQDGDRRFLATEYVEGPTLRETLSDGPLAVSRVIEIAGQVAAALAAAHAAGIIHRDIKPENVIVRPDGLVKVLDFGVAKFTGSATSSPAPVHGAKSWTLSDLGTPSYMSPEQARRERVDERSDIFSLGALMYELLLGRPAFDGTFEETLTAVVEQEPVPIERARGDVPTALAAVVKRCLDKEPSARYQTASAVMTAIDAARAQGLDNRPDGGGLSRRWRTRKVAVAALISAMLAASGIAGARLLVRTPAAATDGIADQLVTLGLHEMRERTADGSRRAVETLSRAVATDPGSARGYAALAQAYRERDTWAGVGTNKSVAQIREAALRAIALDPNLADGHLALAQLYAEADWNWDAADREFRQTLSLDSTSAEAYMAYAGLLQTLGHDEAAVRTASRGVALQRDSPSALSAYGRALYRARQYDEAIAQYNRALELDPSFVSALDRLAMVYDVVGRVDNVRTLIPRLEALAAALSPFALDFQRAFIALHTGDPDAPLTLARAIASSHADRSSRVGEDALVLAELYALGGDRDRGLEWLERAVQEKSIYPLQLRDPLLDPLRPLPRFRAILASLHMPE